MPATGRPQWSYQACGKEAGWSSFVCLGPDGSQNTTSSFTTLDERVYEKPGQATFRVRATITVGGRGGGAADGVGGSGGTGGGRAGSGSVASAAQGGGGGGASDLRTSNSLDARVLVAGGGSSFVTASALCSSVVQGVRDGDGLVRIVFPAPAC